MLDVDGRVALVRDADGRLVGVHVYYDDCPRDGARVRLLAETVRRELEIDAEGPLYVKWRDGSLVHLEAQGRHVHAHRGRGPRSARRSLPCCSARAWATSAQR